MVMTLLKPKKLFAGATIGVIAPSSYCAPEDSENAKRELEKQGFNVFIHPQCYARDHMSAGTPQEKAAALHDVFSNPDIDAVFCLRGGYQTLNMLHLIDYDLVRRNPKILMGYSDITALHGALHAHTGLVSFHGPNGNGFGALSNPEEALDNESRLHALKFLKAESTENLFRDHESFIVQAGHATGHIIGGNMQLLCSLIEAGDQYMPSLDGAILMIEDIGEEITKIERQFSAWRLRGIFNRIAALVIGHMTDIRDTPGRAGAFAYTLEDVVRRHALDPETGVKGPVIMQAPFGHELPNYIFPQGVKAEITAQNGVALLNLLESPFSDA